jgi:hypothetical protein
MQLVVYGGGWAPEYMAGCHFLFSFRTEMAMTLMQNVPGAGPFPVDF